MASYSDVTLYRRLLRQARLYWPHIGGIFLLSLLSSPLALLTPLPLKIAVDSVVGSHPLPGFLAALLPAAAIGSDFAILAVAAGLLVAITLLSQLQELASSLLRTYTGELLVLDFRTQLFRHIQRLSLTYADTKGTSDSTYRIQYDAPAIQYIAIDGVIPFIAAGFTIAGMIAVTARIDWQLALVALAIAPVLFLVTQVYRRRLRQRSREVKKLESSALAIVQEVLAALRVVKAFGQEDREQERFFRRSSEGVQARLRLTLIEGGFGLLVGLISAIGTSAVLWIGIRHVQSGALTLGELLLVMSYLSQLYEPLKTMSKKAASLQSHLAGAERAFALLDEAPDVVERPKARPLAHAAGAVAFRNVSFAYEQERPILHDLSFEVPAVEGVDLRDYKLADLRSQFALVLQEPVLFSTSIAENIAYARPGASEREIAAAAQAAGAHDFIAGLPQGYATLVGERGMRLSGGERQRIALARAFLKDAPILILDEPTSSVDMKTEAEIMTAMKQLMRGRTTFMIAHRLSTLDLCDVRVDIEHGRIMSISDHTISVPPKPKRAKAAARARR